MRLTEAQQMVYKAAKGFADREIKPFIKSREADDSFPIDVLRKMDEVGLVPSPFPEQYGGVKIDYVSYALICEAIGGVSPSVYTSALAVPISLVGTAIHRFGSEDQRRSYLPALLNGRRVGAFALSEPNVGSDPAELELSANPGEGGWELRGSKYWISNGSIADLIVVFAQTEPGSRHKGLATFLVDGNSPGLRRESIPGKLGLHSSNTAVLHFDGVRAGADRILGAVGDGFRIAQTSLTIGRMATAACAVGVIQTCLDACISYARQRTQWGKPIGGHQLIQEIVADMATSCEAARLLTLEAARLLDEGEWPTRQIVMGKQFATEAAVSAARNAISLHGGAGYVDDLPIQGLLGDAIGLSIYEGTTQIQKLLLGRELLGISAF